MAQNPLLGNRISLISKKNIRYEGTLYSINESNATVALQNVRSYGTEGRETTEPDTSYVPPQDEVHPYLLFRGCDIKDLHVHEAAVAAAAAAADAAAAASSAAEKAAASTATEAPAPPPPAPPAGDLPPPPPQPQSSSAPAPAAAPTPAPAANRSSRPPQQQQQNQNHQQQQQSQGGGGGGGGGLGGPNRRPRKPNPANQVGTGASLLNRKARGTVEGVGPEAPDEEFDFQSKLEEFEKEGDENEDDNDNDDYDDEAGDGAPESGHHPTAYEKDDFFDSISCDAIDRERGLDNRLRGANERHLNTETFGAVALNSQRRRRGGGRGSGGRGGGSGGGGSGRGGGRGSGRGRGRGRGRSGRGRGGAAGGSGGRYSNSTGMPAVASS